jgi:hypothetical protein
MMLNKNGGIAARIALATGCELIPIFMGRA